MEEGSWIVAMNLYSELKGTSLKRGASSLSPSTSTPLKYAARRIESSVGFPISPSRPRHDDYNKRCMYIEYDVHKMQSRVYWRQRRENVPGPPTFLHRVCFLIWGGVCFLSRGQLCFLFDHDLKKKSPVKRKKVVMSPMFFQSMHKKYVFQS